MAIDCRIDTNPFSIRLNASEYESAQHDRKTSQLVEGATDDGLQSVVERPSPNEIQLLREGAAKASNVYCWFQRRPDLPDNPLVEGI
jgi:hypothetical protein